MMVVTDGAGNADTCFSTVTVQDNELPVLTACPGNIVLNSDPSSCGAVVTWTGIPTATDNCGVTVSSTHNPGDTFPGGETTVTYTATDDGGNTAVSYTHLRAHETS